MSQFTSWSIRAKILTVVVACLVFQGLVTFINTKQVEKNFTEKTESVLGNASQALGAAISAQIYERYGDVQAFAINHAVRTMDPKLMQNYLEQYVTLYGIYDVILVVDKNGNYVSSNMKDVSGKAVNISAMKATNYRSEVWFKNVIEGKTTDDKDRGYAGTYIQDFIADPLMESAFGEKRYGTSFSAAIKDDKGEIIGVVTNRAGKRWFEAEVEATHKVLRDLGFKDVEVTIVNGENKIVSYLLTDSSGNAKPMTDSSVILSKNFVEEVKDAGSAYMQNSKGFGIYKMDDGETDVVAFNKIVDKKWPASIGWGVFVHDAADDALAMVYSTMRNFYFFFASTLFIGIAAAVFFSLSLSKSLSAIGSTLKGSANDVASASQSSSSVASQLSESATEQAAAIQETMAAIDEINAMVEKNSESAQRSQEMSQKSRATAERGQEVMNQMLTAIDDIDQSTVTISDQMQESNKQLAEITGLINDISSKTKVINEIVFQTKLLSFNASVEAARAGEYGKGFSVVAEEVGNLAQMSGNAAREISDLLNTSVEKVNMIVEESKRKVDRMIQGSKEKVKVGADTARECTQALEEIIENVQNVDALVAEIVVASTEQATGIKEVSKAVGQMENVSQRVSSMAQSSSASSSQLGAQAEQLKTIVQDLTLLISGEKTEFRNEQKVVSMERYRKPSLTSSGLGSQKSASKKRASSAGRSKSDNFNASAVRGVEFNLNEEVQSASISDSPQGTYINPNKVAANSDFIPGGDDPGFNG